MRVYSQTFVVAGAIIERRSKFLLVRETKGISKGMWNHPAGWVEIGENPVNSAKKEVKEETGFDFRPTHLLGVYSLCKVSREPIEGVIPHPIKLIFVGTISKKPTGILAPDVSETHWFSPEEIYAMDSKTLRDVDIKQMVKDYLSGRRFPLSLVTHTVQSK